MLFAMLENEVQQAFERQSGRPPRATVLCYGLAVLHAAVAVSYGIYGETARSVAAGLVAATALLGLWIAIGTALSLLASIADRVGIGETTVVEETVVVPERQRVEYVVTP